MFKVDIAFDGFAGRNGSGLERTGADFLRCGCHGSIVRCYAICGVLLRLFVGTVVTEVVFSE